MSPCLLCRDAASSGLLCTRHAVAIACPWLISEQILSSVKTSAASLIDAWGFPHPVAAGAVIGRAPGSGLAILHPSVSEVHGELRRAGAVWSVVDRDSRNGVTVDGAAVADAPLVPGAMVGFGDVRFYFWTPSLGSEARPSGRGRTAPSRTVQRVFGAEIALADGAVVALAPRGEGGYATIGERVVELARMEFGLLKLLVERRRAVKDPEQAYVAWHEIAQALAFDSVEADSENVRALVRRLRRKFETLVTGELIESKHGVGYRIGGHRT